MARGSKSSHTSKQKRQAEHIERGYEGRGVSSKESTRRASATVSAESHGAKKSASGRGRAESAEPSRRGGMKASGMKASSNTSSAERSRAAKKGWEARR